MTLALRFCLDDWQFFLAREFEEAGIDTVSYRLRMSPTQSKTRYSCLDLSQKTEARQVSKHSISSTLVSFVTTRSIRYIGTAPTTTVLKMVAKQTVTPLRGCGCHLAVTSFVESIWKAEVAQSLTWCDWYTHMRRSSIPSRRSKIICNLSIMCRQSPRYHNEISIWNSRFRQEKS